MWFCERDPWWTLARFERVNLALFLRDLDWDAKAKAASEPKDGGGGLAAARSHASSLVDLEAKRSRAMSFGPRENAVKESEELILQTLDEARASARR